MCYPFLLRQSLRLLDQITDIYTHTVGNLFEVVITYWQSKIKQKYDVGKTKRLPTQQFRFLGRIEEVKMKFLEIAQQI